MSALAAVLACAIATCLTALAAQAAAPVFTAEPGGGFTFDTGLLRGTLHEKGKSLGLTEVIHVPTGQRLDRSNGLLSHYRVFTKGARYGGGAWDWPSEAKLLANGAVQVRWPAAPDRPFDFEATYRWHSADTLDLETTVHAQKELPGFESFVACYFNESFTNAAVYVAESPEHAGQPGFLPTLPSGGTWQMFPRDEGCLPLIEDGRWKLEPNPVDWTIRPRLAQPLGFRRDPQSGLTAVLMSAPADCFAVAGPQQTEGHYSMYFSLFGRNLRPGETGRASVRLLVGVRLGERDILERDRSYRKEADSR